MGVLLCQRMVIFSPQLPTPSWSKGRERVCFSPSLPRECVCVWDREAKIFRTRFCLASLFGGPKFASKKGRIIRFRVCETVILHSCVRGLFCEYFQRGGKIIRMCSEIILWTVSLITFVIALKVKRRSSGLPYPESQDKVAQACQILRVKTRLLRLARSWESRQGCSGLPDPSSGPLPNRHQLWAPVRFFRGQAEVWSPSMVTSLALATHTTSINWCYLVWSINKSMTDCRKQSFTAKLPSALSTLYTWSNIALPWPWQCVNKLMLS